MKKKILIGLLSTFLVFFAPAPASALDQITKVKAVFLFKFFDYVTWPSGYVPGVTGDGILCTLGEHNFGDTLDYIAARKSDDFRFRVTAIRTLKESSNCHILFVSGKKLSEIKSLGTVRGVLMVSDGKGFLDQNGVIEMREDDGKVRLVVDLAQAQQYDLKISSRLLDIAEVKK